MKKYLPMMMIPLFALASQATSADSMRCGTHVIQDDQTHGQSRSDVENKCGKPQRVSGDSMFYIIDNVTYRLDFNDNDELESIIEELE